MTTKTKVGIGVVAVVVIVAVAVFGNTNFFQGNLPGGFNAFKGKAPSMPSLPRGFSIPKPFGRSAFPAVPPQVQLPQPKVTIVKDSYSPASGIRAPGADQTLAKFTVQTSGLGNFAIKSLRFLKDGANFVSGQLVLGPAANVTKFDLLNARGERIATVGDTTLKASVGPYGIDGTSINVCTGTPDSQNELGNISLAEWAHVTVGDTLIFDDASAKVVTVTNVSGTPGACSGTSATLSFNVSPSVVLPNTTGGKDIIIYSNAVYFDAFTARNNLGEFYDQALAPLPISGGTLTLEVRGDTSNIRTGASAAQTTFTFGLTLPGTSGGEGGMTWSNTPLGSQISTTSSVSDGYPVQFGPYTY